MLEKSPCISILIPDGENELLTNHVKDCFSKAPQIKIFILSSKKMSPSCFSRYVQNYSYRPKTSDELQWITNINIEVVKHQIDLIMPVFEDGIRTLIKFKGHLNSPQKLVPLSTLEMFTIANNKAFLAKHLFEYNIPGPKIYEINEGDYTELREEDFPLLVKPISQTDGGSGIKFFRRKADILNFFKSPVNSKNYLLQEFIEGYDIDCSVLCENGIIRAYTIQKGILFESKKYTPPIGVRFLFEGKLYSTIELLIKTLNWSGVAHIDLRYDQTDGQFKVIEVNTRFWGSLDASLSAGVNFPYLYALIFKKEDFEIPSYDYIQFFSLKGLQKLIKQNFMRVFQYNFIWNHTAVKYVIRDPTAFVIRLTIWLKFHLIRPFFKI